MKINPPAWKVRNIETREDFALNGFVQRFDHRSFAEQYRDKLTAETGQRHRVLPHYPPTVGNPKGGRPK
jgi:hypothetical protein